MTSGSAAPSAAESFLPPNDPISVTVRDRLPQLHADLDAWLRIPSISADPAHADDVRASATWLVEAFGVAGQADDEGVPLLRGEALELRHWGQVVQVADGGSATMPVPVPPPAVATRPGQPRGREPAHRRPGQPPPTAVTSPEPQPK